ncbi:MAG: hypothetical protein H0T75_23700, partial [Rhizobiales bacterium]|nr:hypothetical protein [Hyphomicrobiales bacterium]
MSYRRVLFPAVLLLFLQLGQASAVDRALSSDPAAFVRSWLAEPESRMNFGQAKLAIDKFVDPSTDAEAALAKIDGMVATINRMLATLPPDAAATSVEKMRALRAFIYEGGHWNDHQPFRYDLADSNGQNFASRLLPNYLATRTGNCVSMPMLFLILGERLGLDVTLSTAPLHVFVKWTDDADGQTYNFEATNGGFARDSHYRNEMPMTDTAIANGVYMKTLSRREALSVMASLVLEHLLNTRRYSEAIAVADVILEAYPAFAYALVKKGTAYYRPLDEIVVRKNGNVADVSADQVEYAGQLNRANQ